MDKKKLFIIDGSSFLYRSYYAIRPLYTSSGAQVGAVFGFCKMIKKISESQSIDYMVVVWDSKKKTIRHDIYDEYKANRHAFPLDLVDQKYQIKKFIDLIKLKQIESDGIEADDIIYSIAKKFEDSQELEVVIVTSDKDLAQAVDNNIVIFDPFKDVFLSRADLEIKYGFNLNLLPFYFSLVGDASDNIPGVLGIGPKGATDLVLKFQSLDDLYENIENSKFKITDRVKNLLIQNKDKAYLSYNLVILHKYEVDEDIKNYIYDKSNFLLAKDFFQELEFKSFLQELKIEDAEFDLDKKYKFKNIISKDGLDDLLSKILQHNIVAIDTETTGLNPQDCDLVGVSICFSENYSYYIPVGHKTGQYQLPKELLLKFLKEIFKNKNIVKVMHNAKYDLLVLYYAGLEDIDVDFDTMIAASLVLKDTEKYSLKNLSERLFKERMLTFKELVQDKKLKDFSYVVLEDALAYAACDAHQTLKLYNKFMKDLKDLNMLDLFNKIEMPTLKVLFKMEKNGIELDKSKLLEISNKVTKDLNEIKNEIEKTVGSDYKDLNLNSPKQIEALLFDKLNLPSLKKTNLKTGRSTDQEVLKELAKTYDIARLIYQFRQIFKIKSTYIDPLINDISLYTGKIHTSYNQVSVVTGRLSSLDPNLQNIPVDSYHIRSAFIPSENNLFISADYSQIELRVLANLSEDRVLIDLFTNGLDVHSMTAAGLFDVDISKVTHDQRQMGKKINFSILYGLTPYGLSKDIDIQVSVAKIYIEKFMQQYPKVSQWMNNVVEQAKQNGYVETLFKRRRYLPLINDKNKINFEASRRMAINTVVQGTASEIVKLGMLAVDKILSTKYRDSSMLLQIHDEILIETPQNKADEIANVIKEELESVVNWEAFLVVTTRIGKNWQDVTK